MIIVTSRLLQVKCRSGSKVSLSAFPSASSLLHTLRQIISSQSGLVNNRKEPGGMHYVACISVCRARFFLSVSPSLCLSLCLSVSLSLCLSLSPSLSSSLSHHNACMSFSCTHIAPRFPHQAQCTRHALSRPLGGRTIKDDRGRNEGQMQRMQRTHRTVAKTMRLKYVVGLNLYFQLFWYLKNHEQRFSRIIPEETDLRRKLGNVSWPTPLSHALHGTQRRRACPRPDDGRRLHSSQVARKPPAGPATGRPDGAHALGPSRPHAAAPLLQLLLERPAAAEPVAGGRPRKARFHGGACRAEVGERP